MTDTFEQITAEYDETPLLYAATVEALHPRYSAGRTTEEIGLTAWAQLTTDQRRTALSALLGCYARQIAYEQQERAHQAIADDTTITTYLTDDDTASAWDAVATHGGTAPDEHETVVDRQVLTNLLTEVDLLRRRLDTAGNTTDAA